MRAVRRARDRAVPRYDSNGPVLSEIASRLFERLDYIKQTPRRILDLGAATGANAKGLQQRYPAAEILAFDCSEHMLRLACPPRPWWRALVPGASRLQPIAGDPGSLPIVAQCLDMVWSNLFLFWFDQAAALKELSRVLAPGGLLMLTTFGPDTLKELRRAYKALDDRPHINRFLDMHDLGDLLVSAGFVDPVVDMEILTVTYDSVLALLADLRASGSCNAHPARGRGLSRNLAQKLERAYPRQGDGKLAATFEVVFAHGWRGVPRSRGDGTQVIKLDQLKRKPSS